MRFEIRAIEGGQAATYTGLGRIVGTRQQAGAAKRFAERVANDYHYGVAIVDTREGVIDWGDNEPTDLKGNPKGGAQ